MDTITVVTEEKTPEVSSQPVTSSSTSSFDPFRSHVGSFLQQQPRKPGRKFRSSRLKGEHPKPWLEKRNKRAIWSTVILYSGAIAGIGIGIVLSVMDLKTAPLEKFCENPFWEDTFETLDSKKWTSEVQLDGFGTGSFDWTTTSKDNAYVDEQGLHIVPTLTTESTNITTGELTNGYTLNLTSAGGDGSCTATGVNVTINCSVESSSVNGTMIPPIRSARLTSVKSLKMAYGKIEVEAKLPSGDWLWPAIWMMPADSKYGIWPQSGEIDIMESRGNSPSSYKNGRDSFTSTIHWGPNENLDGYYKKGSTAHLWRSDFSKSFHTYAIEWTPNYIFTYYDNKLQSTMYTHFGKKYGSMWEQGDFGGIYSNGSAVANPWANAAINAPFDQEFYLILNVAVGGTNGWFPDNCWTDKATSQTFCKGDKPWRNDSPSAVLDFWNQKEEWYPTWGANEDRGMTVRSVKAYKYGGC